MELLPIPLLIFLAASLAVPIGMIVAGRMFGPRRDTAVKAMPYESGMTPIHDTHRRFDIQFHLIAIDFLVFDVELLFLYPWAVARRGEHGLAEAAAGTGLIFAGVMLFLGLLIAGWVYAWRKGVFQWR